MSYASTVTGDGANAYWPLTDAAGQETAVDLVAGNNGTGVNGPVFGETPGPLAGTTAVRLNAAQKQYISLPLAASPGVTTFSVEALVNPLGAPGYFDTIAALFANGNGWEFITSPAAGVEASFFWGTNPTAPVHTPTGWHNDYRWHHVVVTCSGGTSLALYVDNVQVATATVTAITVTPTNFNIGAHTYYGDYFNGAIAQVSTNPNALTPTQVSAHYAAAQIVEPSVTYLEGSSYEAPVALTTSPTTATFATAAASLTVQGQRAMTGSVTAEFTSQATVYAGPAVFLSGQVVMNTTTGPIYFPELEEAKPEEEMAPEKETYEQRRRRLRNTHSVHVQAVRSPVMTASGIPPDLRKKLDEGRR